MKKIFAFTMAEVLITLGIIGVVAAMTLPTLVQNYQKNVLKAQIKKSYSYLSQVLQKVKFEYGDSLTISGGFGYRELNDAIIDSLKIAHVCEGNALKKGCITKYVGLNQYSCSGFSERAIYNTSTIYVLSDGSFLIPYAMDWRSLWLVDVNGKKGPNKAGYDLFDVALDSGYALEYRGEGCLNQPNPTKPVKGGLDNFKNIDRW